MDEAPATGEHSLDSEAVGTGELIEMANALLVQATALKEHYRALEERLDGTEGGLGGPSHERQAEAPPDPEGDRRTMAMNLALSGAPRTEVDTYLRETLGSTDHDAILDEIFGDADGGEPRRRLTRFARRR